MKRGFFSFQHGLLLMALAAGLLLVFNQRDLPVTAEETAETPESAALQASESSAEAPQPDLKRAEMVVEGNAFTLEVAETPEQLRKGLMYRTKLPVGHGMLFPFSPARPVNFWMKNTKIPLDMLFIRRNRVVHLAQDVPPCLSDPCPSYPSGVPVDRVVELPAGTARQTGIECGDKVEFRSAARIELRDEGR